MPRRALILLLFVISTVCCVVSQQQQGGPVLKLPKFKTLGECEAKEHEWEVWGFHNGPKYRQVMRDADRLEAENDKLKDENDDLRSANYGLNHSTMAVSVLAAAVGIGIGAMCAFWLVRGLKRLWPVSPKAKQLVFMVCGAVWITGAAVVAVNDSDLSKHPVNMLFTVLVYSLPGFLFGGIGFWWFGRGSEKGAAAHG